jgi:hypothetical protein
MRHPFQRRGDGRHTVKTPFQRELVAHFQRLAGGEGELSGRQISNILGRSANHVSQMLNDGFVPSGESIVEMAELLKLDRAQTDRLIRAAMETKAAQRSRDNFWIRETLRMLSAAERERKTFEAFLEARDLAGEFRSYAETQGPRLRKSKG